MGGTRSTVNRWLRPLAALAGLLLILGGEAAAERLPIKAYNIENGLAHNRVKRIVQDSHGFVWFCTAGGLSRFDGYQFTNYGPDEGLPALSLNDLVEVSDGIYWIATNSAGVIRFDVRAPAVPAGSGAPSRFTVYPLSNEPVTNRVNVLYRDASGLLWAGTDGGLFRLNERGPEKKFEPVHLDIPAHPDIQVQVWAIVQDRRGNLWIGTKFGLVQRFPDGRMAHHPIQPAVDDDRVAALALEPTGTLWVGHRTGLVRFESHAAEAANTPASAARALRTSMRRYTALNGLDNDTVLALHRAADGRLWVRTFGPGLTEFDGVDMRTYDIGEQVGDVIGALTEDREGNLWLGTNAIGALKIMRDGWRTYGPADGLGESVASIFESRSGDVYVNSSGWRISQFTGNGFITVKPHLPASVSDDSWRDVNGVIQDHAGEWWIATRNGLYRFPRVRRFQDLARVAPAAVYTTAEGLANNDVTRLFEDSRGDIWITSWLPERDPIVRWERATGTFHRYSASDGLRSYTSAVALREDTSGNIWVGFREGGLYRFRDGRFASVGEKEILPPDGVNSLYLDRAGRLWAAAGRNGLCRIDAPNADHPSVVIYSTPHGLSSSVIMHVTGDLAGRIYASHMRGVDRLDPDTLTIKHYSTSDGLPGSEFKSALRDHAGALWFASTTALARLIPNEERQAAPPPILIGALRIAGLSRPVSALGETEVGALQLESDQNNIQIEYFGVGFRAGEALRYQYKLEGATSDWSAPASQRNVDFANLAPGRYRFLVRAVSTEGTLSPSPAAVAFEILPPFWRRWWFLALATSIVSVGVAAFARSRYERVRALRESENRFRTLAETASDAIITIDEESRIVLVNRAAEKLFGYTREEMLGADLTTLIPAALRQHFETGFMRYRETGEVGTKREALAVIGVRKNGGEVPLEISIGDFTRNNRRYFTAIIRDVTERKRAEEALRRSREERLIELERVRKRIATDLHDDVGSSLTRISLLSEVVRQQVGSLDTRVVEPLSSIAGLSRELVDSMSDIVWAVNPAKDHLSDLSQRMRQFVSDVCTARQIDFQFRTPSADSDITLGANVRREAFLLFKEAVNNMVRHSGCSHADLEFRVDTHRLILRVSDNGRGFDTASAGAGHGLRSMRERTAALGGHLEVISHPGAGTSLTFTVPLSDQAQRLQHPRTGPT